MFVNQQTTFFFGTDIDVFLVVFHRHIFFPGRVNDKLLSRLHLCAIPSHVWWSSNIVLHMYILIPTLHWGRPGKKFILYKYTAITLAS